MTEHTFRGTSRAKVQGNAFPPLGCVETFGLVIRPADPNLQVEMIDGVPLMRDVSRQRDGYGNRVSESSSLAVLRRSRTMTHVFGTYDTYRCKECEITLSGYKRGDPGLHAHVYKDLLKRGTCAYIKAKFKGREKELVVLRGALRFQNGFMAFPEFALHAKETYIAMWGTKYCVICACTADQEHLPACADMICKLKSSVKDMKFEVPVQDTLLFNSATAARTFGRPSIHEGITRDLKPGDRQTGELQAIPSQGPVKKDFSVLGDTANMIYIKDTVDKHWCCQCGLTVSKFVQGDSLLGEHIYHVYNHGLRCHYLEARFAYDGEVLKRTLGKERYRKGQMAFPDAIVDSTHGYCTVARSNHCMVCGTVTSHGFYLPTDKHGLQCSEMFTKLAEKLKDLTLIP